MLTRQEILAKSTFEPTCKFAPRLTDDDLKLIHHFEFETDASIGLLSAVKRSLPEVDFLHLLQVAFAIRRVDGRGTHDASRGSSAVAEAAQYLKDKHCIFETVWLMRDSAQPNLTDRVDTIIATMLNSEDF